MDTIAIKLICDSNQKNLYNCIIDYDAITTNDVWITVIICITIVLLALMTFLYFRHVVSIKNKNTAIDKEQQFLDFVYKTAQSSNKEDEAYKKACWKYLSKYGITLEENKSPTEEDKEVQQLAKNKQRFIEFCFEMSKTAQKDDKNQDKYWEILKKKFDV